MTTPRPLVMKFGGTSVEDAPALARAAEIVGARKYQRPVVVVSAMSRVTDALLAAFRRADAGDAEGALSSLTPHFARHMDAAQSLVSGGAVSDFADAIEDARREISSLLREVSGERAARARPPALLQDAVVSFGERLSSTLFSAILRAQGLDSRTVDARRCVVTDDEHACAAPLQEETDLCTRAEIEPLINANVIPVLGGFIGATPEGETTTLGRGGSDYSAALVGAAL
ncbi:MAG: lysine-sensitive aspartokinase 3, partial [Pyrinomonadaceae bacterium]